VAKPFKTDAISEAVLKTIVVSALVGILALLLGGALLRAGGWSAQGPARRRCGSVDALHLAEGRVSAAGPIDEVITVFEDRTFTFITKMPPMSALIKKAAGLAKGSGTPNKDKVGKMTLKQVEEVAKIKLPDLNTKDVKQAMEMVKGTARSMGVDIV